MPKKVVIDTDPGLDDALALLLALGAPELEVLGLTTVAGNVSLAAATRNAHRILALAGRPHLPVTPGAEAPLLRPLFTAGSLHGQDGLGDILPPSITGDRAKRDENPPEGTGRPKSPRWNSAADFIRETAHRYQEELTLVALGPLTNVALALREHPILTRWLKEVVIMGGSFTQPGNVTLRAEFNVYVDPEAARIVLHSGIPLRLVGLEIGRRTRLTRKDVTGLVSDSSPVAEFVVKAVDFWSKGDRGGLPMYDPTAVAMAINPELFRVEEAFVDVETRGELTLGETVADFRGRWQKTPNARLALDIDVTGFLDLFLRAIGSFCCHGPSPVEETS